MRTNKYLIFLVKTYFHLCNKLLCKWDKWWSKLSIPVANYCLPLVCWRCLLNYELLWICLVFTPGVDSENSPRWGGGKIAHTTGKQRQSSQRGSLLAAFCQTTVTVALTRERWGIRSYFHLYDLLLKRPGRQRLGFTTSCLHDCVSKKTSALFFWSLLGRLYPLFSES